MRGSTRGEIRAHMLAVSRAPQHQPSSIRNPRVWGSHGFGLRQKEKDGGGGKYILGSLPGAAV